MSALGFKMKSTNQPLVYLSVKNEVNCITKERKAIKHEQYDSQPTNYRKHRSEYKEIIIIRNNNVRKLV